MGKLLAWVCCLLILVALAGCQADPDLVEEPDTGYVDAYGNRVGTPYWWRTHPFFKGKKVDEEATLAAGDPYLVILADDEQEGMYSRLTEALKHQYSEEQILHMLLHHRDHALSLKIPGVNMSLLEQEIPLPSPNETVPSHCDCPWEWNGGVPPSGCEENEGGSPPPPPLPPRPQTNTFLHEVGDYVYEEDLPAPRSVRLYLSTVSTNGVDMKVSTLNKIRVTKDAIPALWNFYGTRRRNTQVHAFTHTFHYGDPHRVFWFAEADHIVNDPLWSTPWEAHSTTNIYY